MLLSVLTRRNAASGNVFGAYRLVGTSYDSLCLCLCARHKWEPAKGLVTIQVIPSFSRLRVAKAWVQSTRKTIIQRNQGDRCCPSMVHLEWTKYWLKSQCGLNLLIIVMFAQGFPRAWNVIEIRAIFSTCFSWLSLMWIKFNNVLSFGGLNQSNKLRFYCYFYYSCAIFSFSIIYLAQSGERTWE